MIPIIVFIVSFISNFFSAVAGGGAGLIQLPALLLLGLPYPIALSTHKLASVFLGIGSGYRHVLNGKLKLFLVVYILSIGIPGVALGASFVSSIPEFISLFILGILIIFLSIYSFNNKSLGLKGTPVKYDYKLFLVSSFNLFIIAFLNGSFSSGTGLFMTIWLIYYFGLDYLNAVSYTLILVGIFWNLTGAIVLGYNTPIYWNWVPSLIFGSLLGGYIGASFSLSNGNILVKKTFEIMTVLIGLSLICRSIFLLIDFIK